MSFHLTDPCLWCIEQSIPAGIHDILGPVYVPCPACLGVCPTCEGEGLFPADFTCMQCFCDRLFLLGLAPLFCAGCSGVIDLVYCDTRREVTPHVHH
ncbi:hypothetical protein ACIBBG_28450 [Micromonospora chersina]|uniref:hypothetical protein n=1 Tax=Micromonospora chersina TaxID=47854 RepID=UPI0037BBE666